MGTGCGGVMRDLKIALIQADLVWQDAMANTQRFGEKIAQLPADVQLIVLPEMFPTGFSMDPAHLAQQMTGPTVKWMQTMSKETQADIAGSLIITDNGNYYNRLVWTQPDDTIVYYDKKHLFRYAGEDKAYTPGDSLLLVNCHGWRVRPFICYDLRFPMWTRNLNNAYDAALFVANWPEQRSSHWRALLKARAVENQCYVAGVNRVGVDGTGSAYQGDSCIIDPKGRIIAAQSHAEGSILGFFSASALWDYRKEFPAWMDADSEQVAE